MHGSAIAVIHDRVKDAREKNKQLMCDTIELLDFKSLLRAGSNLS